METSLAFGRAGSFEQFTRAVKAAATLGPPSANLQVLAALVASPEQFPVAARAIGVLFVCRAAVGFIDTERYQ